MKHIIFIILLFSTQIIHACTTFGIVTASGTIIGKNRDSSYGPQTVGIIKPSEQFRHWHGNHYRHENQFYALTASNGISMGVNQHGLAAIEEDALRPKDAKNHKRFLAPEHGSLYGMVLHGVLQNFNTIDEMIPYLSKIFSTAAPDFYQFADTNKILTVEVAFAHHDADKKRPFTYHILSKKNERFTHTNTYLNPRFTSLNQFTPSQRALQGAENRLNTINDLISHAKSINIATAARWFLNTRSNVSNKNDKNGCLNSSIFRSNLQGKKSININIQHHKVYGTVGSMIISNHGNLKNSTIYLRMLESITTDNNGQQIIKYKDLRTSLVHLFDGSKLTFVQHQFTRNAPINRRCS